MIPTCSISAIVHSANANLSATTTDMADNGDNTVNEYAVASVTCDSGYGLASDTSLTGYVMDCQADGLWYSTTLQSCVGESVVPTLFTAIAASAGIRVRASVRCRHQRMLVGAVRRGRRQLLLESAQPLRVRLQRRLHGRAVRVG